MDSEAIKAEIVAKLEIEREVREQLARQQAEQSAPAPPKASRWGWLESKVGLLLVGAIISGVLVPTFQYNQEKLKWHRQNRYENLERQLGSMRESLKQFIAVQALSAQLYDLGLAIRDDQRASAGPAQREQWRKEFRALQARRVEQNGAFAATVFYFPVPSQQPIRKAWNDLMRPAQKLQTLVGELLNGGKSDAGTKAGADGTAERDVDLELDVSLAEVNQAYEQVLSLLRQQLMEVERESAKFQ
jgi:hypothetical protein